MKKVSCLIFSLVYLSSHPLFSLPVGNPSEPTLLCDGIFQNSYFDNCYSAVPGWSDLFPFRIGFYGNYVYNRNMRIDGGGLQDKIDTYELNTNAAYFAATLFNCADLFATLGATSLEMHNSIKPFAPFAKERQLHVVSSSFVSWSLGARAALWQCHDFTIGAEGEYFSTYPKTHHIISESAPDEDVSEKSRFFYAEWQVGLGVSYQYRCFVPYVAAQYARARTSHHPNLFHIESREIDLWDLKSANPVGLAIGASLVGSGKALITIEGRFFDEEALSLIGQLRF